MRKSNVRNIILVIALGTCLCVTGCSRKSVKHPDVATTSSYLTAAVKDICGENQDVMTLSGPGNCPGHFDIKPSQIETISAAKIFMRFNFQNHFDRKLSRFTENGLKIIAISPTGGMCDPSTYMEVCRQVATALNEAGLISKSQADQRLVAIEKKLAQLSTDVKEQLAKNDLTASEVIAAKHQAAFCKAIGLVVLTPFSGSDIPTELSAVVEKAKDREVKFVIGNAPQGQATPQRLAELTHCQAVMFDNFPAPAADGFYKLVRNNISRLYSGNLK